MGEYWTYREGGEAYVVTPGRRRKRRKRSTVRRNYTYPQGVVKGLDKR